MATTDFDEPAVVAADVLSEIVAYVKNTRPVRSGEGITQGFVFSFQKPGDMISPRDFDGAWHPIGGTQNPQELINADTADDDAGALAKKEIVSRALKAASIRTRSAGRVAPSSSTTPVTAELPSYAVTPLPTRNVIPAAS